MALYHYTYLWRRHIFPFFHCLSFTLFLPCLCMVSPIVLTMILLSSFLSFCLLLLQTQRSGWLQLFTVHFLVRRLLSAARAILFVHNAVFSLTLIKVHLASKCCGPLNTDCAEKRKWKRQSKQQQKESGGVGSERHNTHTEREGERKHHVDKGRRNNGLMVNEGRQNNHCSPLTRLNIGLMLN